MNEYRIGDRVRVTVEGSALDRKTGTILDVHEWDPDQNPYVDDKLPYMVQFDGGTRRSVFAANELEPYTEPVEPVETDDSAAVTLLNKHNECLLAEAQSARILQAKLYSETQELRRLLAQVTAERDAANAQTCKAVGDLDALRTALKALAR